MDQHEVIWHNLLHQILLRKYIAVDNFIPEGVLSLYSKFCTPDSLSEVSPSVFLYYTFKRVGYGYIPKGRLCPVSIRLMGCVNLVDR